MVNKWVMLVNDPDLGWRTGVSGLTSTSYFGFPSIWSMRYTSHIASGFFKHRR